MKKKKKEKMYCITCEHYNITKTCALCGYEKGDYFERYRTADDSCSKHKKRQHSMLVENIFAAVNSDSLLNNAIKETRTGDIVSIADVIEHTAFQISSFCDEDSPKDYAAIMEMCSKLIIEKAAELMIMTKNFRKNEDKDPAKGNYKITWDKE